MHNNTPATILFGFFLAIVVIQPSRAQNLGDQGSFVDTVDNLAHDLIDRYSVPGAAIAVVDSGRVVHIRGYGVESNRSGKPVSVESRFRIGSISKTFTAWGVMSLVEDDMVDLDAPVTTYLDRWRFPASSYDESKITLRRLLSHTAGTSVEFYDGYEDDEPQPSLIELLDGSFRDYERVEIISNPGIKWEYSGGAYSVVQLAIEDITGETFSAFLNRSVIRPLKLSNTTADQSATAADAHNMVGDVIPHLSYPATASGGLLSSIEDMAAFLVAGLGSAAATTQLPLTDDSILEMQTPSPDTRGGYGLGYSTRLTPAGDAVVGHGAAMEGWHANFAMLPARGKGIVILTNSTSGGNVSTAIRCAWYADVMGPIPGGTCKSDIAAMLVKPLKKDGIDSAISLYHELKLREDQYQIDEWQLNSLGYDLLEADRIEDAVRIFELNVQEYPDASNPHDSLAEAYVLINKKEDAIRHYRRSLELDPSNENARTMLTKLGG